MAFCNSCGANLPPDAAFCSKCGAPVSEATPPRMSSAATGPATPAPKQDNTAIKTVLIVVGVIVVLGIFAIATLTFVGLHIAKNARVEKDRDNVKIDLPFAHVETDPEQAAKNLGVDIYPGAEVQKEGASVAAIGSIRTSTAAFQSDDPTEKVCSFYRERFPNAKVSASQQNHCAIVSQTGGDVVTINVESRGDGCRFQITTVNKHAASSSQ